jgi:hypothetical protein
MHGMGKAHGSTFSASRSGFVADDRRGIHGAALLQGLSVQNQPSVQKKIGQETPVLQRWNRGVPSPTEIVS